MDTEDFLLEVQNYRIPPESPNGCVPGGYSYNFDRFSELLDVRSKCISLGMWALVTKRLAKQLANYINGRKVLEIMSGVGWLAKALADQGVDIHATDDYSWEGQGGYKDKRFLYPVHKLDCIKAIEADPHAELLLVSWPHMTCQALIEAVKLWGSGRPVIYIGEGYEGCCAPNEFFDIFLTDETVDISMDTWPGIHDYVYIGVINEHNGH